MRHVPQHREDDEPGQEAGETVDGAGEHRVPVAVVVELVVAGEGEQGPESRSQWEEDLRGGVDPHLRVAQLVPLGGEVVADALGGARKGDAADEQDYQDDVRSDGRYPDRLWAKVELWVKEIQSVLNIYTPMNDTK